MKNQAGMIWQAVLTGVNIMPSQLLLPWNVVKSTNTDSMSHDLLDVNVFVMEEVYKIPLSL